jgi:hypothetical protein
MHFPSLTVQFLIRMKLTYNIVQWHSRGLLVFDVNRNVAHCSNAMQSSNSNRILGSQRCDYDFLACNIVYFGKNPRCLQEIYRPHLPGPEIKWSKKSARMRRQTDYKTTRHYTPKVIETFYWSLCNVIAFVESRIRVGIISVSYSEIPDSYLGSQTGYPDKHF